MPLRFVSQAEKAAAVETARQQLRSEAGDLGHAVARLRDEDLFAVAKSRAHSTRNRVGTRDVAME